MSSGPTTTNDTATAVNMAIDDAIRAGELSAEAAIESALDSAAPVFILPVFKQISDEVIKLVVEKIGSKVSVALQTAGTFIVIDAQISGERKNLSDALLNLMVAEKSGDKDAIKKAIQVYADANSALIHDDGSAPPVK